MECLEKVRQRQADFLAVDPEDMYVAFNMKNEDFSVFSEIRTVEEPNGKVTQILCKTKQTTTAIVRLTFFV